MCVHDASLLSTVVDCGALRDPANGRVNDTAGTTLGQTATYSCNTGYNLVGNGTRMCQATGVWSGSAPTCERMLLMNCQVIRVYMMYPSFQQLRTVALCLTQQMAKLMTLLEQHLDRQPPTVVIQATTWWETVLACVRLQECGLGVHLPVNVCRIRYQNLDGTNIRTLVSGKQKVFYTLILC